MYTHIHAHTEAYARTYTHVYTHRCTLPTCMHIDVHMHTHMYMHTGVHPHTEMHTCTQICTHVHMHNIRTGPPHTHTYTEQYEHAQVVVAMVSITGLRHSPYLWNSHILRLTLFPLPSPGFPLWGDLRLELTLLMCLSPQGPSFCLLLAAVVPR